MSRVQPRALPAGLDQPRLDAWRALLKAHAAVVARIELDLGAGGGAVPLTWYDVLLELRQAPQLRLRQRDLANSIVLTRSGISRLIDRLEAAGLVRCEANPEDRRGDLVVLTSEGDDALRRTWPAYARGIAEHFAHYVEPDEARTLRVVLERVRAAVRNP